MYIKIFADLTHLKERNVEDLSGGELQRFACAVVCIQKADMYVMLAFEFHFNNFANVRENIMWLERIDLSAYDRNVKLSRE